MKRLMNSTWWVATLVVAISVLARGAEVTKASVVEVVPGASLSPEQRTQKSAEYLAALEENLRAVLILLEYAREQKQAVRISCLVEKIELLTPHVQAVRRLVVRLLDKSAAGESAALYEAILPHVPAVMQLRSEADACVGDLARYADGTVVEVTQKEPSDQETIFFAEQVVIEDRPPAVSPYQLRQL